MYIKKDVPQLPHYLVMNIRQDATDMSELEAKNSHKMRFERTLELIDQIKEYTSCMYLDILQKFSRFSEAFWSYVEDGGGSRVLSEMIEEYIINRMNSTQNVRSFMLVCCVYHYDYDCHLEEQDRWDRMYDRDTKVHISPSAIYRKNEIHFPYFNWDFV
jgi:hypothetical protein